MFNDLNYINTITNLLASLPAYISYSIIIFPLIALIIYIFLYKYLKLELSLYSFCCFSTNLIIFISFSLGSFSLLFANKSTPIYLNDLSIFAQHRYLFICIASLIAFLVFLLSYFFKPIKNNVSFFLLPHLQEEIRQILYIKNETVWGPLFTYIIENLEKSKFFMVGFYTIHFSVFYVFRAYVLWLFIEFTFLGGDLRNLWYCVPFSFIYWLLQFLNYYFSSFLMGSYQAFHDLFVFKEVKGMTYVAFSQAALKDGYPEYLLELFTHKYRSVERVAVYFQFYCFYCKIIAIIFLVLRLLCWYAITWLFFFSEKPDAFFVCSFFLFGSLPKRFMCRTYAAEAFYPKKYLEQSLQQKTFNAFAPGHFVDVDMNARNPENPAEVLVKGSFTTGLGTTENPSYIIDEKFLLNGTPALPGKPQRYIPLNNIMYIDEKYFYQYSLLYSKKYIEDHKDIIDRILKIKSNKNHNDIP